MTDWSPIDSASPRRPLRRPPEAKVSGVSGAMAATTGLDPNIFRALFIVLAFAGGAGFLAYLGAWILIPALDTDEEAISKQSQVIGGGLVGIAAIVGLLTFGGVNWVGVIVLAWIVAGIVILNRRPAGLTTNPATTQVAPPPPTMPTNFEPDFHAPPIPTTADWPAPTVDEPLSPFEAAVAQQERADRNPEPTPETESTDDPTPDLDPTPAPLPAAESSAELTAELDEHDPDAGLGPEEQGPPAVTTEMTLPTDGSLDESAADQTTADTTADDTEVLEVTKPENGDTEILETTDLDRPPSGITEPLQASERDIEMAELEAAAEAIAAQQAPHLFTDRPTFPDQPGQPGQSGRPGQPSSFGAAPAPGALPPPTMGDPWANPVPPSHLADPVQRTHWAVTKTAAETSLAPPSTNPDYRPTGPPLASITMAAMLAVLGVALVLNTIAGIYVGAVTVVGIGMGIVGLMMAISSFRGRSFPLIPLALLTLILLPFSPTIDHAIQDGTGGTNILVTSADNLQRSYQLGVGELFVDLSGLEITEDTTVSTSIGTGSLVVIVPADMVVEVQGQNWIGYIEALGQERGGIGTSLNVRPPGSADPDAPRLIIDAQATIGSVEVYRDWRSDSDG